MSLQTTDDLLHAEGDELSPFGGLEPSTPLTMRSDGQLVATGGNEFGLLSPLRALRVCHR
jgi:hypothetical protein